MTGNIIRLAIVGGGIAGATLFQALHKSKKQTNLDVHLFEAAPELKTAGYFISFGTNAASALEVLGLEDRLIATNPVKSAGQLVYVAAGKDAGKLAYEKSIETGTAVKQGNTTQRDRFLVEMLKDVDQSRLNLAKKLKSISETEHINLEFEDGSCHTCDVLVGADGIRSLVREFIVGPEHPSAVPSFAGWQCLWTEVPVEDALHYLGKDLIEGNKAYSWSGYKTWMMHNLTKDKTQVSCIVLRMVNDEDSSRRKVTKAELEDWVKDFDVPIGKAMASLLTRNAEVLSVMPLQHHDPQAWTYVKGRITIIGDAADSTVPFRASAGSFALEDAAILGACLEKVDTLNDAGAALKAYESIQKPRRARLVQDSHRVGRMNCGCLEDVGLDSEKIGKWLEGSGDWIQKIDMRQQIAKALELMEKEKHKLDNKN